MIETNINDNLRAELFFFKLRKHFPDSIDKVYCDRQGSVFVKFKNGRGVTVNEQDIESVEFLAMCAMIHDIYY